VIWPNFLILQVGKLRLRERQVIKIRRGFMTGLGQASGLLGLFLLFLVRCSLSPQGRNPFILASAVPLICAVTSYKSFPLWSQFLHLNLGSLRCAALYRICHLRRETLAVT